MEQDVATEIPDKSMFKLDEVCTMTGLKPYTLKFWEQEFKELKPIVSSFGKKLYGHHDLRILNEIKNLLFIEKMTMEKAKEILPGRLISTGLKELKAALEQKVEAPIEATPVAASVEPPVDASVAPSEAVVESAPSSELPPPFVAESAASEAAEVEVATEIVTAPIEVQAELKAEMSLEEAAILISDVPISEESEPLPQVELQQDQVAMESGISELEILIAELEQDRLQLESISQSEKSLDWLGDEPSFVLTEVGPSVGPEEIHPAAMVKDNFSKKAELRQELESIINSIQKLQIIAQY